MMTANTSVTSLAAHRSIRGSAESMRGQIVEFLRKQEAGATCDEIELQRDLRHQTASARVHERMKEGRIVSMGLRPTRSGRSAHVWVLPERFVTATVEITFVERAEAE